MEETKRGEEEQEMRWDVRILWPTSAIRYIEALGLVEKKMATHEGRGGIVDRLKNKNGILYDKRPRIPSSSNVFSVDFSFFFFFSLSLPRRCVFFGLFAALFFFPLLPKVHLIPDFPLVLLVSCLLNVPESLFFSLALTHPRGIHVLAARARGGKDRPTRRAVHPILRRPDK